MMFGASFSTLMLLSVCKVCASEPVLDWRRAVDLAAVRPKNGRLFSIDLTSPRILILLAVLTRIGPPKPIKRIVTILITTTIPSAVPSRAVPVGGLATMLDHGLSAGLLSSAIISMLGMTVAPMTVYAM